MDGGEQVPITGLCLASRKVAEEGQPVRFMYRTEPDLEADTGWRLLHGDEAPEYLATAGNVVIHALELAAQADPEIIPFLRLLPPAAFARPDEETPFAPVTDLEAYPVLDKHVRNLCTRLALNPGTWQRLQEAGATAETEINIHFRFRAPGEPEAKALAAQLQEQGCQARAKRGALLRRHQWAVVGSEPPDRWTLEKLNDWVYLMVLLSKQHDCDFDGWSTTVIAE